MSKGLSVAITGAGGYVGSWLRGALAARGHMVRCQDRYPIRGTAWPVFDLDSSPQQRRRWLDECRPDVVIHLAALYGRVWGEKDLISTVSANAGVTAELARDCAQKGIRMMFMSSSEVYGRSADIGPVSPGSPLEPYNMYGLSKKWGEEAARLYAPDGLMITRLNMPYGPPKDTPEIGERPHTSGRPGTLGYNVIHSMAWEAEHGFPLHVHRDTERCLTWMGDTATGLAMILESGQAGTWNVCRNDDHHPVAELAQMVLDITGSVSEIVVMDRPGQVTTRKSLTDERLRTLGWVPRTSLADGIRRSWEYYRRFDKEGAWQG